MSYEGGGLHTHTHTHTHTKVYFLLRLGSVCTNFRGFGFVSFRSHDDVQKVMSMEHWIMGKEVRGGRGRDG